MSTDLEADVRILEEFGIMAMPMTPEAREAADACRRLRNAERYRGLLFPATELDRQAIEHWNQIRKGWR